ncbi:MAG: triose-phosphate isomerase [Methanobacteriota archaeon]
MLKTPLVLVNYKTYPQGSGPAAVSFTKKLSRAAGRKRNHVAVAPPMLDVAAVARADAFSVFAQHVDAAPPGPTTGHATCEAVLAAGAVGSLLNHAERQIPTKRVEETVVRMRALGLSSVVCSRDVASTRELALYAPNFLAIEPPELIGGKISVTTADPAVVADGVKAVVRVSPATKTLCGAGVKTGEDVARAIELGAEGVLVASGVVLAQDPGEALKGLLEGLS